MSDDVFHIVTAAQPAQLNGLSSIVSTVRLSTNIREICFMRIFVVLILTVAVVGFPVPSLAQQYRFSDGPKQLKIEGLGRLPARQSWPSIYCFYLPDTFMGRETSFGMMNGNAITWTEYPDHVNQLTAYVITSTLPEDQSASADFKILLATDRATKKAVGDSTRFLVDTGQSAWGPTIKLRMKNVAPSNPDGLFPLTRGLYEDADGPPYTRSVHRLFMRKSHRFEIAVVSNPKKPNDEASEAATQILIETLADELTNSLQECTDAEIKTGDPSKLESASREEVLNDQ